MIPSTTAWERPSLLCSIDSESRSNIQMSCPTVVGALIKCRGGTAGGAHSAPSGRLDSNCFQAPTSPEGLNTDSPGGFRLPGEPALASFLRAGP